MSKDATDDCLRSAGKEWSKAVYSLAAALLSIEELTSSFVTGRAMAGEPIRPPIEFWKSGSNHR